MKNLAVILAGMLFLTGFSNGSFSHELSFGTTSKLKWNSARLEYMPFDRNASVKRGGTGHPGIDYVIVLPNRWAQTQTIRVCFVGGSDALRSRILQVASNWFKNANIKLAAQPIEDLTCKTGDNREIRIGFSEPGYWSYVGNDSINPHLISNNLVSMNLAGFDVAAPDEPQFSGLVLHEWGHALGLHHEHQSPAGGCDEEYNWEKLYSFYKAAYGWEKKMVDDNVRQFLADRSAFDWSEVDPKSIMIYASDPQFLKTGSRSKCYFHENHKLSRLDIVGIRRAYPPEGASVALQFQANTLPIAISVTENGELREALLRQNDLVRKIIEPKN